MSETVRVQPAEKPPTSLCARCNKPFVPMITELKTVKFARHCEPCMIRNLTDALGFPTHPSDLDPHSKDPALSEEEYRRKLAAVKVPEDIIAEEAR